MTCEPLMRRTSQEVQPFPFRVVVSGARMVVPGEGVEEETAATPYPEAFAIAPVDPEEMRRQGRAEGEREGLQRASEVYGQQLEQERNTIQHWLEQFTEEKQRYFSEIEGEVVRLSLAIAERILHREANMDPTFLAAAVRVALQQAGNSSRTVLRTSANDMPMWRDLFRRRTDQIEIVADGALEAGDCFLETSSGTVRLGVRAQLEEIERGFFELLQRRPVRELPAS